MALPNKVLLTWHLLLFNFFLDCPFFSPPFFKLPVDNWMDSFYHSDWKKELYNEKGSVTRV